MTAPARADARLPRGALALAALNLPLMAMGIAANVHMPAYFAASIGVPLAAVAAAFGTVRLIDVPLEIFLGLAMERTRSRLGRYRLWTLAGAPILMLGLFMLLSARPGVGAGYLVAWLLVMYLGASVLTLSLQAWGAALAGSYNARARLFGLIAAVGVVGSVSVATIPAVLSKMGYSDGDSIRGIFWYLILLAPAVAALAAWRTPETVAPDPGGPQFRLRDYLELVTNPSMWRILSMDLFTALAPTWMGAVFVFFLRDYMRYDTAVTNVLLIVSLSCGLIGAPATAWLATRIGKHRAVWVAGSAFIGSICSMPFMPSIALYLIPSIVLGLAMAGLNVMTRAMTADVADEIRLTQGRDRSALLYALTTLTSKLASGLAVFLALGSLSLVGYAAQPGAVNTPEKVQALALVYAGGPAILMLLGMASMIGYRLDAARAADVRRQIEERDAALQQGEAAPLGVPGPLEPVPPRPA